MTDKVQKIREEAEKRYEYLKEKESNSHSIESETRMSECHHLLLMFDSLQEEPVSIWHDASKKSDNPEDVVIINPSDNTGEVLTKCTGVNQGHIWAYTSELLKLDNLCNIGKNLQESQVKESAELQHVNETCKENGNSLTKEPANEDLETFAKRESEVFAEREYEIDYYDRNALGKGYYWGCIDGAKWQAEQFEKNRLAACDRQAEEEAEIERDFVMGIIENEHRQPTYDDAIKYGMRLQKEQMMTKAVDGEVTYGKSLAIPSLGWVLDKERLDYGDKVKLIIIKED